MRLFCLLILARLIISGRNHILKNNATKNLKKGYRQMQIFQPSFDDQSKFIYYIIPPFQKITLRNTKHFVSFIVDGICYGKGPNYCPKNTSHKKDKVGHDWVGAHDCEEYCKVEKGSSQYAFTKRGGVCVCCIGPVVQSIPGYCAYGVYGMAIFNLLLLNSLLF